MSIREEIEEWLQDENEEALFMNDFDDAIIGVVRKHTKATLVCYSYDKMVEVLMRDMGYEEAVEYISYNIECAYLGENQPVILYQPMEFELESRRPKSNRNRYEMLEFDNIKEPDDGEEKGKEKDSKKGKRRISEK